MARSHHRKKHKAHLRQYQQSKETRRPRAKSKPSNTFGIVGAVAGFAIGYFATQGNWIWVIIAAIAGYGIGYLFGKNIARSAENL